MKDSEGTAYLGIIVTLEGEKKRDLNALSREKVAKLSEQAQDKLIQIERNIPMAEQNFDFNYEMNPVVRSFYLSNDSPYSLNCQIAITPKTADFMNFRIPISYFSFEARPHSNVNFLAITKLFPHLGWGDYELKCFIQLSRSEINRSYYSDDGKKKTPDFQIRTVKSQKVRDVFNEDRLQVWS